MPGIQIQSPASSAGVTARARRAIPGADEEFQRRVERVDHPYVGRQGGRVGDGAERAAVTDRGDGRAGVEEGHHVELGPGVRAVEAAQQAGRGEPPPDTSTRRLRRPGRTEAAARSAASRSSRACGRKAWPSAVSSTPARHADEQPRAELLSRAATRLETACWVIDRPSAASENWPRRRRRRRCARSRGPRLMYRTTARCDAPAIRLFAPPAGGPLLIAGVKTQGGRWGGSSGGCGRPTRSARSAPGSAFGAFPLIAILVLHAGPGQVSLLAAAGLAVGAAVAVPLGPWVEFRRKRPVMIAMDLSRFAAVLSIPVAYALGWLSFAQLLVVSVVSGAADIAFKAASGAYLKTLVPAEDLLVAERAVGVDDLDRHRARAAARRRGDRAVRPGDDRAGRRGQLPAVGDGHPRYRRRRAAPARPGARGCAAARPARRMAAYPDPPGAAPAVPQHG